MKIPIPVYVRLALQVSVDYIFEVI